MKETGKFVKIRIKIENIQNNKILQKKEKNKQDLENCDENFTQLITKFKKSEDYNKIMTIEFQNLVECFMRVEFITEDVFEGLNTISFEEILKGFIEILNNRKTKKFPLALDVLGFKILRKIIEFENTEEPDKSCIFWKAETYEKYSLKIKVLYFFFIPKENSST